MKVLVIDDEVIARTQLAAAVQRAGHIAIRASDGARAWSVLEDNPDVSLLITDIGMPVMGGDELLRRVRSSQMHHKLPVIIVTASDSATDHARFHQMGANELLIKPIVPAKVAEVIERILAKPARKPEHTSEAVFQPQELITRLGGDKELATAVISAFLVEQGRLWAEFEKALAGGDVQVVQRVHHRLKGTLLNLGAPRAVAVAAELDQGLKAGQVDSRLVRQLAAALEELVAVLRPLGEAVSGS